MRLSILKAPNPKQTNLQKKYSPLLFLEEHFRTARYGIYILKPQNYHRRTMKSKTLRYVETLAARRNHSTPQNDLAKESPSRQESKARVGKEVPINQKREEMKQFLVKMKMQ